MDELTRCAGIKLDGGRCTHSAREGQTFCHHHDPALAEQRSQTASKAGKARGPGAEIVAIKKRIRSLADDVVEGRVDRGKASVAFQGLGVLKGYIELERRLWETRELAEKVESWKPLCRVGSSEEVSIMDLRGTLRRLQREVQGPIVRIPQRDGRTLLFRQSDLAVAYLASLERERGNADADHPLAAAARDSSDPVWSEGAWAGDVPEHEIEDLSE